MKTFSSVFVVLLIGVYANSMKTAAQVPYFRNVTTDAGLGSQGAFRIAIADVNGDGYPDLLVHEQSNEATMDVVNKNRLYLNVAAETGASVSRRFIDFTDESGIQANRRDDGTGRHSSLGIFADVDNDGDMDMFTALYYHRLEYYTDLQDRMDLMLNDGEGHFTFTTDMTLFNTGLLNTSSAVFLDYNLDGNLDIYVGNWFLDYNNNIWSSPILFEGHGDGSFTDITVPAGLHQEIPCYAVAAGDWNKDGWMDLFTSNYCRGESLHWRNNQDGTFSEIHSETQYGTFIGPDHGPTGNTCSWGSMPRDFDNDGDLDFFEVFVHGGAKVHSCPLVNDAGVFTWAFETARRTDDPGDMHHGDHFGSWLDVDNNGAPDFVLTECGYGNNRIYCMIQNEDHYFITMNAESGLSAINDADLPPHNASPIDYDKDGDDDLLVGFASTQPIQLWENDVGTINNWIGVHLEGAGIPGKSNRSAVGARVEVRTPERTYYREVYAGHGHFSPQKETDLIFGLGQENAIQSITVYWPNEDLSSIQIRDVGINQYVTITEDRETDPPEAGVRLEIPQTYFQPGDTFFLDALLYTSSPPVESVPMIVLLDIGGQYWFYDDWSQDLDYVMVDFAAPCTRMNILPDFIWPDTGSAAMHGITFWAAAIDMLTGDIMGGYEGLAQLEFGFGPSDH